MNEIKVTRMLLAALAMFVVWVAVEILVEQILARPLFGQSSGEMWMRAIDMDQSSALNMWVSSLLGLMEAGFEAIEFLVVMLVGAGVYEGREQITPSTG
jgi:hypothetical protein